MKKCLIFGGSVFVGKAIAEGFVREGHQVYVLNRGNHSNVNGCIHLQADRNDGDQLDRALEGINFDIVVDGSAYEPFQTRLAIQCLSGRVSHFIHISSAAVYQQTEVYPLTEESPVGVHKLWGDYGRGKYLCEQELIKSFQEDGFPMTIFRPFYIYGPGNNLDREMYIFRRLVKRRPIIVPGNGSSLIQFGHIDDLVEGLVQCMLQEKSFGQIYNIAGDEVVTLKGWVEACAEVVGMTPKMELVRGNVGFEARQWFPFRDVHLFGSCHKLKQHLGIQPRFSLLEGLRDMYNKMDKELFTQPMVCSEVERAILKDVTGRVEGDSH
ncbi:SDR family oxidoreductase [Thermoactinomyces sp. DSM 45892]|uniref:SDR family oxidoreductase n=1 Tax=Thermoactinomyces sp. DSM 45892 TaxID=1882753 RepID=UPI00089A58D7|nr:SDR family oxidoreductase [Thermoactinomyces sp. DSM 45892]SDY26136.1 dTDP-glucose 4,6-dehydratase [Thermoactinomyces sp. DSM 45892]